MIARMSRRDALVLGVGAALAAPFVSRASAQTQTLYVNSYGGAWEVAWRKAFFDPFTAETKVRIETVPGVSFAKLKAQVQSRNYTWDVANMGDVEVAQAIREGLLEKVDRVAAKADQLPSQIVREHAITSYTLATTIVYRKDRFPNGGPQGWQDFWNVKKFPGARSLQDQAYSCLAYALLADGVPIGQLFPLDVDRAFSKMNEIKPHIKVWWTQGSQSQQLIRDGEVDIIAMWSARAVDLIEDNVPLEIVWNGAEIFDSNLIVPKGDPKTKIAWEFCNFVAQPQPQANFVMLLPYGPINPAARALVPQARLRQTPAWPDYEKVSFRQDADWLAPRLPEIRERWSQWLTT